MIVLAELNSRVFETVNMKVVNLFLTISVLLVSNLVFGQDEIAQKSAEDDKQKIATTVLQCNHLKDYVIKSKFSVSCNEQYFLFGNNPSTYKISTKNSFKIANYNLLHPGTSKSLFKDYFLVAKVANSFDFVSAQEVLSLVGHDADVNSVIDDYISTATDNDTTAVNAKNFYRIPGYLKLLFELKKLDPSWSLILSPRGDAALQGSVEEHVGFYYRSSLVNPKLNPYCNENKGNSKSSGLACIVNYGAKNKFVSRRPFMGSFKADSLSFTVVSSHIVFNFSGDDDQAAELIKSVFGKDSLDLVGGGVNSTNFARFAEVKLAMEFIKKYSDQYKDNKVIFSSDTNLTPEIDYWNNILSINPGTSLLINEATTLSPPRYNKSNEETNGVANSYDHFVLNKKTFGACDNGHVYNYYNSTIEADIENAYMIRSVSSAKNINKSLVLNVFKDEPVSLDKDEDVPPIDDGTIKLDYPLTKAGQDKMDHFVGLYQTYLQNLKTIKNGKIVLDDYQINDRIDGLKKRIFLKQLTNPFYYRFYQELLSDHFPAYITCQI